jgi:spermidine synthase
MSGRRSSPSHCWVWRQATASEDALPIDGRQARTLFFIFIGIAVWILVLVPFQGMLMLHLQPLGPRLGALLGGAILVLPPLTGLGMVNPFSIRLRIRKTDEAGDVSGTIAAISTAGSLLGAMATGFWLIPWLGLKFLFLGSGFVMALMAYLIGIWGFRKKEPPLIPAVFIVLAVIFAFMRPNPPIYYKEKPVSPLVLKESNYGQIAIAETADLRAMYLNGTMQSRMKKDNQASFPHYTHGLVRLMNQFLPESRKVLVIGLGGGAIPISLERQGFDVTALDIDPIVVDFARKYMGFDVFKGKVVIEDARVFLNRTSEKYGVIILDAFSADAPPFHLATAEAFEACKEHLEDDGVLVTNYICSTAESKRKPVAGILASMRHVFPDVRAYGNPESTIPVNVLIAAGRNLEIAPDSVRFEEFIPPELATIVDETLAHTLMIDDPVPLVTDNKYWLDLYDYPARLAARGLVESN